MRDRIIVRNSYPRFFRDFFTRKNNRSVQLHINLHACSPMNINFRSNYLQSVSSHAFNFFCTIFFLFFPFLFFSRHGPVLLRHSILQDRQMSRAPIMINMRIRDICRGYLYRYDNSGLFYKRRNALLYDIITRYRVLALIARKRCSLPRRFSAYLDVVVAVAHDM